MNNKKITLDLEQRRHLREINVYARTLQDIIDLIPSEIHGKKLVWHIADHFIAYESNVSDEIVKGKFQITYEETYPIIDAFYELLCLLITAGQIPSIFYKGKP